MYFASLLLQYIPTLGVACAGIHARGHSVVSHSSIFTSAHLSYPIGFVDDVLDIPWRYKMTLPLIASMPLIAGYDGGTTIIVPRPFRFLLATPAPAGEGSAAALVSAMGLGLVRHIPGTWMPYSDCNAD